MALTAAMKSSPCLCEASATCPRICPLNLGTSYFKDKSVTFYRDPEGFINKHLEDNKHRAFVCRLGMRPCFVIADNQTVKEFLNERTADGSTYNGLKDFFFGLFGHSILFSNEPEEAHNFRSILLPLFTSNALSNDNTCHKDSIQTDGCWYGAITKDVCDLWLKTEIDPFVKKSSSEGKPIILYDAFKKFASQWVMRVFLGAEGDEAAKLSELATSHWHGLISVPLNVKISFLSSSSTYRQAVDAKQRLLEIIEEKIKERNCAFLNHFHDNKGEMDIELVKNHILVFVCSLIPKALASTFTSFIYTARYWRKGIEKSEELPDEKQLRNIFMEVLRLWPPFLGAYRVTNSNIEVGDFCVPKGYGVLCATFAAHRDPKIFSKPDEFLPERWENENAEDRDKMFGFGSGPHSCVGERIMWKVLVQVGSQMMKRYTWTLTDPSQASSSSQDLSQLPETFVPELDMKYLPVSRPRILEPILLEERTT